MSISARHLLFQLVYRKMSAPSAELEQIKFTKRTDIGKLGVKSVIVTNFFEVKKYTTSTVYQYDISITPVRKAKSGSTQTASASKGPVKIPERVSRHVFDEFFSQYANSLSKGVQLAYDGQKVFYSPKKLDLKGKSKTFSVETVQDNKESTYEVKVSLSTEIKLGNLIDLVKGSQEVETRDWQSALRVLDTVLQQSIIKTHYKRGRSFYNPSTKFHLGGGIDLYKGVFQSVRPGIDKLFINMEIANTCFLMDGQLIEFISVSLGRNKTANFSELFDRDGFTKVSSLIKGIIVSTSHRDNKTDRFRVSGISKKPAKDIMFEAELIEGKGAVKMNVPAYFVKKYNYKLKYPNLPCIEYGNGNYMPIEMCFVPEGQHYKKKLNEEQTREMMNQAKQHPKEKLSSIMACFNDLLNAKSEVVKSFDIVMDKDISKISARILPPPTIFFKRESRPNNMTPRDGSWNFGKTQLHLGRTINSWGILVFADKRRFHEDIVYDFLDMFVDVARNMDFKLAKDPPIAYGNPFGDISGDLKGLCRTIFKTFNKNPELLFVILPNTSAAVYNKIKNCSLAQIGVQTQCILSKNVQRPSPQTCGNVILKLNAKFGGINSTLMGPGLGLASKEHLIVFGADVSHPGSFNEDIPSIAAVTASTDSIINRYNSIVCKQPGRVEIIQDLRRCVVTLLKKNYKSSGKIPTGIIFYRDGVSEGQYEQVLNEEIKEIREACKMIQPDYSPPITFIVATKRHHTRFFPTDSKQTDRSGNCSSGTVVDTLITNPSCFDFYLQSHQGLLGTSRSTHYTVLVNEKRYNADQLQQFTYNLCYQYSIATKAVSIVTPVYYAHRAALKGRNADNELYDLTKTPSQPQKYGLIPVHPNLADTMYFM
ncbi:Protein argonaute 10 [Smittium mucronatum]|uniref:Protein argonaute 10 n=1 Tax=Smittium mucronatum TaxID=133383 RepID=A0A1R0GRF2_9FUNG|nr:Protein argonaute 10 [Smittium mucronatum]